LEKAVREANLDIRETILHESVQIGRNPLNEQDLLPSKWSCLQLKLCNR